jgi:hypothetical protein
MKITRSQGHNTDMTSQYETIDSDAMDVVAFDSHGMDVVALDVGAVVGGPSAEEIRMQTTSKILCRQDAGLRSQPDRSGSAPRAGVAQYRRHA